MNKVLAGGGNHRAAFEGTILISALAFLQPSISPANAVKDAAGSRVAIVAIARMIGIPIEPHLKAGTVVQLRRLLSISLALRPRRGADLDQYRPTLIAGTTAKVGEMTPR